MNTITQEYTYSQSPGEVWQYLTQSELIAQWLMPNDFEPKNGHEFTFRYKPVPSLNLDGIFYCKVLEILPFQKLVYSWKGGPGNGEFIMDTIVEWTLKPYEKGTKLFLHHTGFKEENFSIFSSMTDGWQNNVKNMISHLNNDGSGKQLHIGVIGAGQIGATLIRQFTAADHHVKFTNASGVAKHKALADETKAKAAELSDVIKDIDVLIVSIPFIAVPDLAKSIANKIDKNTVIIDTTNYYPIRDGKIEAIENGMPESIWVANQLKHPVVKVYNSILAGSLAKEGKPFKTPGRIALPVSGDDAYAKAIASRLVHSSGFDAFDAGDLEQSWRQQPGSPVYCTDLTTKEIRTLIATGNRESLPEKRELALAWILEKDPAQWLGWYTECVQNNRHIFEAELIA